ncbi:MAG: primase C-terminal domain-containing protein [Bacteroidales bacterium]|nr:primase C-terminal domain-containing protein [Bacteroidales bacterium]
MINYDNIPDELRQLKQWVCVSEGSKAPKQALTYFPASSTNPATWSTFEDAVLSVKLGLHDYIGFVFNDNGIVGIDIDDAFDASGGITDITSDIISICQSYTERSKSMRGYHIFVKGDVPFKGKNNLAGVEVYKTARFFIMTGHRSSAVYHISENQEALDYIVDKYFPETREKKNTTVTPRIYNPEWDCPKGSKRIRIKPKYPVIQDGCRNICLTSLAGMMHSIGYSKGQIYRELQYANNTACKPPLNDGELKAICNSVTRYQR